jgi:hypothetical protein
VSHPTHIASVYFRFGPVAGHLPDCPRAGTGIWEVTRHARDGLNGETRETTIRVACFDCGVVRFETFNGAPMSTETTHASETGYGSRPEKVAGLWLHPGPRIWHGDDRGPTAYYVTRTKDRPRVPADAIGIVGWHLGKRHGVRWGAGLQPTDYGTVARAADQDWPSRRAAVAWIAAQIAAVTT